MVTLLAQVDPTAAGGWGEFALKAGLGLLSFIALCYGGFRVVQWLVAEIKDSRVTFAAELKGSREAYLASLDRQHVEHKGEVEDAREWASGELRLLRESIERGGMNGRDRQSNGGGGRG